MARRPALLGALTGQPSGARALALIREHASKARAEFDEQLAGTKLGPSKKPLIFSI